MSVCVCLSMCFWKTANVVRTIHWLFPKNQWHTRESRVHKDDRVYTHLLRHIRERRCNIFVFLLYWFQMTIKIMGRCKSMSGRLIRHTTHNEKSLVRRAYRHTYLLTGTPWDTLQTLLHWEESRKTYSLCWTEPRLINHTQERKTQNKLKRKTLRSKT